MENHLKGVQKQIVHPKTIQLQKYPSRWKLEITASVSIPPIPSTELQICWGYKGPVVLYLQIGKTCCWELMSFSCWRNRLGDFWWPWLWHFFFWGGGVFDCFLTVSFGRIKGSMSGVWVAILLLRTVVLKSNWQSVSWKIPFAGHKTLIRQIHRVGKKKQLVHWFGIHFLGVCVCVCWQLQPILQLCRRGGVMFDLQRSPANLVLFESNYFCFNRIHIPSWFIQSSFKYTGCLKNEKRTRWVSAEPQETDNGKWQMRNPRSW